VDVDVSAGLPKENPADPDAGVDDSAGLLPNENALELDGACAGLPPKIPLPVLAPKPVVEGGGPAGVVDGPPNENVLLALVVGVLAPNNDGPDMPGTADFSGVWPPNPPKADFAGSLLLVVSWDFPPKLNPPLGAELPLPDG